MVPFGVHFIRPALRCALAIGMSWGGLSLQAGDDPFWESHVAPLLKERCGECHNPLKAKSRLDLSSLQTVLRGGDRGAAVLPGRVEDSLLFRVLSAGADPHMPPKGQLSEDQVDVIRTWISRIPATAVSSASTSARAEPSTKVPPAFAGSVDWVPPTHLPVSRVVDRYLELGWKSRKLTPASLAPVPTLVRRVYLDLVGRVPTAEELSRYLSDRRRDRWEWLVDELLAGPEYSRHMAEVMDVVLMGRKGPDAEKQRRERHWFAYLESSFRENRPWNRVVAEMIRGRPEPADRGAEWYLYERRNNPQAMAEALAPVVFGVQIKCAQCHDHMVAREIKQAHYWGLVAAFNRTRNVDTPSGPGLSESAIGGFVSFANLKKESQPAVLTFFNGRRVDEPWPREGEKEVDSPEKYWVPPPEGKEPWKEPARPKFSRRDALAEAVTEGNSLLSRAMVNRLWALMFGRGLVHPVDLMDSKHPPSHPELLDWLSGEFARSGYDVQRLLREMALTRAYRLDSRPQGGKSVPSDSFATATEKPLSAEQQVASLVTVLTGHPPQFTVPVNATRRQAWIKQFPELFAAEYQPSLQQSLFFANSAVVDELLSASEGSLTARLAAIPDPRARAREAIVSVYGREAEPEELRETVAFLSRRPPDTGTRDLVWALVTSAEFQFNH
ncbi:MAG: DUF1549 domain-containing protein [Verrucomicrobiales bacterium]|nr:DUF1549 domain-containing protein [Verrucomicrobiales bacterium]